MQNQTFQGRGIDLQAFPNRLPATSLNALIGATQHILDSNTSSVRMLPGDHYVTAGGNDATATQAFDVTLRYQVPTLEQAADLGTEPCASLLWWIRHIGGKRRGCGWPRCPLDAVSGYPLAIHPARWGACRRGSGAIQQQPVDIAANWTGAWQAHMAPTLQPYTLEDAATSELSQLIWSGGIGTGSVTADVSRWVSRKDHVSEDLAWGGKSNRLCPLSRRRHHRARQRGAPGAHPGFPWRARTNWR